MLGAHEQALNELREAMRLEPNDPQAHYDFGDVLAVSGVWVNGDEPESGPATTLHEGDEIAVLPPVSGGSLASRPGAPGPVA